MDELTKYDGGMLTPVPEILPMQQMHQPAETSIMDMLIPLLLRRWRIIVTVFLTMCGVGLAVIWLGIKPRYEVTGAIRVAPILANILTGAQDKGEISNYQSFMNTQARIIVSPQIIQRVADDLYDKNLSLFKIPSSNKVDNKLNNATGKADYADILKQATNNKTIAVAPAHQTELIEITMVTSKPKEAKIIVDSFIRSYMSVEGMKSTQDDDQMLSVLEDKRRVLTDKLATQREEIGRLAQEYGTVSLDGRQKMMLDRVSSLLTELTKVESQRINSEATIKVLEQGQVPGLPEEMLSKRNERINTDPSFQEIVRNIVRQEQELLSARQIMTPENPLLKQREEFVEAFKKRLEERRKEIIKDFESQVVEEANSIAKNELRNLRARHEEAVAYETLLREKLAKEDADTIEIGRKQLKIQDMQYQLELDKGIYDTVMRRIQELEMERKQPARVSVAYPADIVNILDKRIKFSMGLVFLSLVSAMGLALIKDKADPSLQSPDDIAKRIGIRIIGTTTRSDTIEKAMLPRQLTEDYQTIRANLGLLEEGGLPKKLVVTSAGIRDGKTTFSVNLATSLSRSGRKVLLIDADLRKPDIGRLLNVPRDMRRLMDVLAGNISEDSAITIVSPGLHVLVSDSQNVVDPYELLVLPSTASLINKLAQKYDHVIIDTPPVLAFPDALILAKIAGSVILASFAGHTSGTDLKETKDRLAQINVRILGTVMGNVHLEHTYYRYGYHYYAQGGRQGGNSRKNSKNSFLLSDKSQVDSAKPQEDTSGPQDDTGKPTA
jgi:polysaccharide biosynthesis transport protein